MANKLFSLVVVLGIAGCGGGGDDKTILPPAYSEQQNVKIAVVPIDASVCGASFIMAPSRGAVSRFDHISSADLAKSVKINQGDFTLTVKNEGCGCDTGATLRECARGAMPGINLSSSFDSETLRIDQTQIEFSYNVDGYGAIKFLGQRTIQ